ncbi:hypothetical protein [Actinoplanes sp. NPDC020271]|uniref:hypothetical protein n=1 Tax=Actinoplanes sp. NPDC020271 TaxID=3363896 RepID=UPI00378C97EE
MSALPGVVPIVVFAAGGLLLALEVAFIMAVHHGRRPWRKRSISRGWRSDRKAAFMRKLDGDAYADGSREASHRLVDGCRVRSVPRDHAQHVGGLRVP